MARSELSRRVGVAALGIPLVLGAIYLGGWVLGVFVAAVAALAALEFYRLAEVRGTRPFTVVGATAAGALVLLATARPSLAELAPPLVGVMVAVTLISLCGAIWLRGPEGEPLEAVSVTVAGVLYTGATLAFVPLLRWLPEAGGRPASAWHATAYVLLPLLTTWAGDTTAYFAGRRWGRTKLAPAQSPGKTVEGAVAGLLGSVAAAVLLSITVLGGAPSRPVGVAAAVAMGLVLGALAQLGDLAESGLKRCAGVKDSGRLLPGHGGVLDRMDSLLFAIPAAWGLLALARALP